MPATRELRRRIKSVKSTKQITKALELVSSAKVRRASQITVASRPYAERMQQLLEDLLTRSSDQLSHPLLTSRPVKKVLIITIASDRGLAGIYNTAVLKKALQCAQSQTAKGHQVSYISIGRRVENGLDHANQTVLQSYGQVKSHPHRSHIYPIIRSAIDGFLSGEFDQVHLVYTRFISFLRQEPELKQLIPLQLPENFQVPQEKANPSEFLYEPNAAKVLDEVLPRVIETELYQALLESLASEHAARRIAMQNATDNATDVIDDLTLTYNGLRQNAITQEIAEITGGAAALTS